MKRPYLDDSAVWLSWFGYLLPLHVLVTMIRTEGNRFLELS